MDGGRPEPYANEASPKCYGRGGVCSIFQRQLKARHAQARVSESQTALNQVGAAQKIALDKMEQNYVYQVDTWPQCAAAVLFFSFNAAAASSSYMSVGPIKFGGSLYVTVPLYCLNIQ